MALSSSSSGRPTYPANMLGATAKSPDRGHLNLAPEVIRRIPFRMMVADLRMVGKLERSLAERSQRRDPARRIAAHLGKGGVESPHIPALDAVRKQHEAAQPFKDSKVLVLQHLYASTQSILDAVVACGAKPSDITVMGKPYSGSMKVAASMVEKGFNLVVPSLHQSEFSDHEGHMDALVAQQVTRILAEAAPGEKLMVLDDGGHVAKVVHELFPQEAHRFRFVEQTQRGATAVKEVAAHVPGGLKSPVVNVAESRAKKDHESPSIGYSVWKETKAILDKIEAQGVRVPKSATVLGFGAVGSQVARELKDAGYDVHVYDPDPQRMAQATALGFTAHTDKREALGKGNVLVSATGRTAVSLDDVRSLPKQAVLVNAASANNELNATNLLTLQMMSANALMGTVQIGPKGVEIPRSLISQADTAQLDEKGHLWDTFGGKSVDLGRDDSATQRDRVVKTKEGQDLYVAHAGFVVNLTDDDDPIPPSYIGLTRSLLFAALVQAAGETRTGLVDLDDGVQQQIIDTTEGALRARGETLADPRF
jgi:S-adenosylhomocysteine hydrolase